MIELNGPPAEFRFTIQITRKATGKIESYDLIGHVGDVFNPPELTEKKDK